MKIYWTIKKISIRMEDNWIIRKTYLNGSSFDKKKITCTMNM